MFYGGFSTNFKSAKSVLVPSFILSSLGVLLTAVILGSAIHFIFDLSWLESLLISSVISSTDAASVFNVLRSKNLALKYHTDSMLELESGSNDPMSYMLTIFFISLLQGESVSISQMLIFQFVLSIIIGLVIAKLAVELLNHSSLFTGTSRVIFLIAVTLMSYALPNMIGANGYLSVYLCGIFMGNQFISNKKEMFQFFDVVTENIQMVIFFLLGLLVTPLELKDVLIPGIIIMLILIFVSRPLSVMTILLSFKAKLSQMMLVSWAGLRGVASIVFSMYVVLAYIDLPFNIFNLVFVVVLLSLILQGTLLPLVSKKLDMIDTESNVFYTFNDYADENDISFVTIKLDQEHEYVSKKLGEVNIPKQMIVVLIIRDKKVMTVNGNTIFQVGDLLVIGAKEYTDRHELDVYEVLISSMHKWRDHYLKDIESDKLIIMIKRDDKIIVPDGDTKLFENDVVMIADI